MGRWDRADDITWDEKDSIFKQENAYIMNGHLELKLSKNADYHHDDDHHDDDGEHSDDDSHDDNDFHVLPAPKDGALDAAIEKATRVGVVMVRQYLDHFSESMSTRFTEQVIQALPNYKYLLYPHKITS